MSKPHLVVAAALMALALAAGASAETPVRVFETNGDVLSGFSGSGVFGFVLSRGQTLSAYDLFLLDSADNVVKVNRAGTQGYSGGIDGTTVVYVEFSRATGRRLVRYDTATKEHVALAVGVNPKHPTISGSWILYEDGFRARTSSVRLFNTATGEQRRIAFARGHGQYVYAGQVAGDWATWGRVGQFSSEVYLTNISNGQTVKIPRARGVADHYDPAVTASGTVYFARDRPCFAPCPDGDTPKAHNQVIEERLGAPPRVAVNLPRGADIDDLYAATEGTQTRLTFVRFKWLPRHYVTYGELFQVMLPG